MVNSTVNLIKKKEKKNEVKNEINDALKLKKGKQNHKERNLKEYVCRCKIHNELRKSKNKKQNQHKLNKLEEILFFVRYTHIAISK